jgi:CelD/BcsL family acetyltransferase involved in cellulose biosynthesis
VKVVEVAAVDAIDDAQWMDLWEHSPDATVFQSRDWLLAWQETFGNPGDCVKVLAAYEGTQLMGLAPLIREPREGRERGPEQWRILGEDYSDYQPLLARDGSQRVIDSLLSAADACLPGGATLLFRDVPQFSALGLNLAQRAGRAASAVRMDTAIACPTLRIRGNSIGVARVLSKRSLIRHERALSRSGDVTVQHLDATAQIMPLLSDFFAQHVARWADTAHPSLFLNSANQHFYRAVTARLAPAGRVLFTTVRVRGRVVAQHFGLRSSRSLLWYKPAFDVALRDLSPGEVLLRRLIEFCAHQEIEELDFTRGDETFKSRFASTVGFNRHFTWFRRARTRLRARAIEGTKVLLRRLIPAKQIEQRRLGGSLTVADDARRVLLLDADGDAGSIRESFVRAGINVDDGGITPSTLAPPLQSSRLQLSASQVEALRTWSSTLDRSRRCALIVPCSEAALLALASLPEGDPIRAKAVLAPFDALENLHADGLGARHAQAVAGEAGRGTVSIVLCMYSHGRLSRCHVVGNGSSDASDVAIVQFAKQALDDARWHGFAAVTVEQAADGSTRLSHVSLLIGESLQQAPALLAPFLLDLWKVARCEPLGPQPAAMFMRASPRS